MKIYRNLIVGLLLTTQLIQCYSQENRKFNCDPSFYQIEDGSKLSCIQGVFSPINDDNPQLETYWITTGFKALTLVLENKNGLKDLYEFNIGYHGFYDFSEYEKNISSYSVVDSFFVCDLKDNGKHYIEFLEQNISGSGWVKELTTQPEFYCEEGSIETSDRNLTRYSRQQFLPYSAYHFIKEKGKSDKRDYLKEFDVSPKKAKVLSEKAYFHNSPNDQDKRKAFVIKGDEVFVEEIQQNWIKIAFEGQKVTTEGWTQKSNLSIQ